MRDYERYYACHQSLLVHHIDMQDVDVVTRCGLVDPELFNNDRESSSELHDEDNEEDGSRSPEFSVDIEDPVDLIMKWASAVTCALDTKHS
jgi:hypothetical protein